MHDSIRRIPIPEGIEAFWLYDTDAELKAHSAY